MIGKTISHHKINFHKALFLLALLCLSVACTSNADSTKKDVQDIKLFLQGWERTINAGDSTGHYALWTEDAVFMPDMGPIRFGIEAVRSWAKYQFDNFNAEASVSVEEIVASGDWHSLE